MFKVVLEEPMSVHEKLWTYSFQSSHSCNIHSSYDVLLRQQGTVREGHPELSVPFNFEINHKNVRKIWEVKIFPFSEFYLAIWKEEIVPSLQQNLLDPTEPGPKNIFVDAIRQKMIN